MLVSGVDPHKRYVAVGGAPLLEMDRIPPSRVADALLLTSTHTQMRKILSAILAVLLTACASGGGGTGMTSERLGGEARAVSANLITEQEISAQSFQNAWQAVISLRPTWPKIPVYIGNARVAVAFERLQEVPVATVKEIRLLSREQARVRFGPEAQQTIQVVTK